MRRGPAAVALVALALAVAIFTSGRPIGDAHAATNCVTHAKRVVKHVKRHGKRKRIVRTEHIPVCVPVAAPGPTSPAPTPEAVPVQAPPAEAPVSTPTPRPEPEAEANALGVAADDHGGTKSYTLSRGTVGSGRLTVHLQNKCEDPHDMDIQRVGPGGEPLGEVVEIPVTEPGQQSNASVTVEPGEYRMWCNLYHHAEEGMEATVKVE